MLFLDMKMSKGVLLCAGRALRPKFVTFLFPALAIGTDMICQSITLVRVIHGVTLDT
jgi:hypothetical protein